jgi:hypothetical protein
MTRRLDRRIVVAVYAWCRQAERSIDRTLLNPDVWLPFTKYYDHRKRQGLCAAVEALRGRSGELTPAANREHLLEGVWRTSTSVSGKIGSFFHRLTNRFRFDWCFAQHELVFFYQTLSKFIALLDERERPSPGAIIAMRMDLYACQWAIRNRVGVTSLGQSRTCREFRATAFLQHVSLEDLGLISREQRMGAA